MNDDFDGADVVREVDGGVETVRIQFPAVITRIYDSTNRAMPVPGIMKAKRKPLDVFDLEDLELDADLKVETVGFSMPPERQAGIIVDSVEQLMDKLTNEAKVI